MRFRDFPPLSAHNPPYQRRSLESSQERINYSGQIQYPQVKVKELNNAKTDPKIMEDLFASTYWECSCDPTQELLGQCGRRTIAQPRT